MTDSMVERVAKAIRQSHAEPEWTPWDELDLAFQNYYRHTACGAIAAMREPTDKMLKAGGFDDVYGCPACGYDGLWSGGENGQQIGKELFQSMMDAALNGTDKELQKAEAPKIKS